MARAFNPSRNAIFGAPERQAAVGVAGTIMGALVSRSDRQIAEEDARQSSNATIAILREGQELRTMMEENAADPMSWKGIFAKNKPKIRGAVMKGVTQPGARRKAHLELNETMARWEGMIQNESAAQTTRNADTDFKVAMEGFSERQTYVTTEDVLIRMDKANKVINDRLATGRLTNDQAEALKRDISQSMFGDFLMQEAMRQPTEEEGIAIIESANTYSLPGKPDDGEVFGPDDIEALTVEYKKDREAQRTEAEREARDQNAAVLEGLLSEENLKLSYDEQKALVYNTPGLTNTQRDDALGSLQAASVRYNRTGVDPWQVTTDYQALDQAQQDILSGKITTQSEIEELWRPNGGSPLWAQTAQASLRSMMRSKTTGGKKFSRTHPSVADYFKRFKLQYSDKKGMVKEKYAVTWGRHDQDLERRLEATFPDVEAMNKEYLAVKAKAFPEGPSAWDSFLEFFASQGEDLPAVSAGGIDVPEDRPDEKTVQMRNPDDGLWYTVPVSEVAKAEKNGWTRNR
jgi:hypothetical protein